MLNNIDKIYVCHYTKLTDRKSLLEEEINKLGLDVEWVEVYDKEDINIDKMIDEHPNYLNNLHIHGHSNRKLRLSEISLIFKHNHIWEQMVENDIENVLVLEDDVVFAEDFINRFNQYITELPNDYDLLWVGTCCGIHATVQGDSHIYKGGGSRCTHAYMINKKCAVKMMEFHKVSNAPADFMFNEAIRRYQFKNYWLEPSLIDQNEKFNSTIQNG